VRGKEEAQEAEGLFSCSEQPFSLRASQRPLSHKPFKYNNLKLEQNHGWGDTSSEIQSATNKLVDLYWTHTSLDKDKRRNFGAREVRNPDRS
jgi:hypothetical protein